MADRIKGITIKIGGDTTGLSKSLEGVNKSLRSTQSQLRDVNKLLKLDPKNTELLKQKQDLLKKSIEDTKTKLDGLKEASRQMEQDGSAEKNKEQYDALQREIAATEQQLKRLTQESKNFGSVGAQQVAAFGKNLENAGVKITSVGKKLSVVSGATGALLGASVVMASKFEDQMAKVNTLLDTSVLSADDARKGILEISNATGKSTADLSESMYQALSASVDTGEALEYVETAAQLAKAGFLETAGAVDVLTTIQNAYGKDVEGDAKRISNILIQTQNDGKTTVNELAESLGNVIPTAAALNVNLDNVAASYALMTKQGINTANATTALNGMLTELSNEGSKVAGILREKTGKTFGQLMESGTSLGEVLQILKDSVGGNSEQFKNLWGNVRAGKGALSLANAGAAEFQKELDAMAGSTGNVEEALEKLDTPGARARKTLNMLKNTAIEFGQTALEMLTPLIQKAQSAVKKLYGWYTGLSDRSKKLITSIMGIITVAGPILVLVGKLTSGVGRLLQHAPKLASMTKTLITGMVKLGGIIAANPFMAIAVGAAAAAAGIAALVLAQNKITQEYEKAKKARQDEIKASGAQADVAERYAQKLDELSKKENKSAEDKKLIKQYVDQLNSSVEGLNLTYDEENDKLSQSADQIRNKIAAMRDEAVAQAYQAKATQVATDLIETQMQLEDVRRQKKQAQAELDKAIADQNIDQQDSMMAKLRELGITEDQLTQKQKGLNDELTNYTQGAAGNLGTLGSEFKKLEQAAAEAGDVIPQEIKDGIDSGAVEVPTSLAQLQALMNPQYYNMAALAKANGLKIPAEISTGIDNGTLTAEAAAQRLAASITDDLNVDTSYIGKMLAAGMAGGMSAWESINVVQKSARALVKAAKGAAEDEGRIKSPSRLFRDQIGKNIGLGVAVGMEETLPEIEKQARRLITGAENAMLATPPQMTIAGMSGLAAGVNRLGAQPTTNDNSVKQTINIYQPVSTPAETARAIRQQQIVQGLAG